MLKTLLLFLALILCGCSHECPDSFKEESAVLMKALVNELTPLKTAADLVKKQKKIKRLYTDLADLAIKARLFQEKHPDSISCERHTLDDNLAYALRKQLERIYQIEGGQELMEEAQKEAIEHLDEFESKLYANNITKA